MTIQYTITLEDLIAFNNYVSAKSPHLKGYLLIWSISLLPIILVNYKNEILSTLFEIGFITIGGIGIVLASRYHNKILIKNGIILSLVVVSIIMGSVTYGSPSILPVILVPLLFTGLSALISRRINKYYYSGKNDMIGLQTLTIDEDGIHGKSEYSEARYKWSIVDSIEQNEKYIFIFLGKLKAYNIPKTAFTSLNQAGAFYKKAVELWQAESSSKVPTS
jgi:hypothetical protein